MKILFLTFRISFILLFCFPFLANADIDAIEKLEDKQKDVKTVKASFLQEKYTEILDKPIAAKGTFYYQAPNSIRWEYSDNLVVMYDGKTLCLYYPDLKEAEIIKDISRFPFIASFDIPALKKDYDIEHEPDKTGFRIILKPKSSFMILSIEMFFKTDKAFPEKIIIKEKNKDKTAIKFQNAVINRDLSKSLFSFTPSPGVKVRERILR